ncbi:MAG: AMP-binding protein [Leadbetterella sp.]
MIFIAKEGEIIRTLSSEYYTKILGIIDAWKSGKERFVFKTSGTTGEPKEISFSRKQIESSANLTKTTFGLDETSLLFCTLNADFVAGAMMIYRALVIGCDLMVLEPHSNPLMHLGRQNTLLSSYRNKILYALAPLQIHNIIQNGEDLPLLKLAKAILVGGASISQSLNEKILENNLPVYETYGMTETLTHVAIRKAEEPLQTFQTLKGIQVKVENDSSLHVFYEDLNPNWISTNDLVEKIDEKTFRYIGRKDNSINSGGIKIQLEEMESKIQEKNLTSNPFFCFGIKDEILGQKLVLFEESANPTLQKSVLQEFLGKFEVPKEIIGVSSFYRTPTGKIDKLKTVRERFSN